MAWVKNKDLLMNSSSGGIFTVLANYVLDKRGVVVGAFLNQDNMALSHIIVENKDELFKLRGSKYFQSNSYDIYDRVIEYIKNDKWVLYSGTACQVKALLSLCKGIDLSKLITVDVLCHGVASRKVVLKYLNAKKSQFKKEIKELRFRTKDVPWYNGGGTSICLTFKDDTKTIINRKIDTFFMGFNCDLFLRDSCYKCKFIGVDRFSDFTLADFWGIKEEIVGKQQYSLGVGLVLANSEKGIKIWTSDSIQRTIVCNEVDAKDAVPNNSALHSNRVKHHNHDYFFSHLDRITFDRLVHRCLWREFAKNYIKDCLGERKIRIIKKALRWNRDSIHE